MVRTCVNRSRKWRCNELGYIGGRSLQNQKIKQHEINIEKYEYVSVKKGWEYGI